MKGERLDYIVLQLFREEAMVLPKPEEVSQLC
jgi:hypothetical protein